MTKPLKLSDMQTGRAYLVKGFAFADSDYAEKLHKMGFVEGTPVGLAQVKLSDPMVVQIRGSRVALRKNEARQVLVVEDNHA